MSAKPERLFPASVRTIGLTSPASLPDAARIAEARRYLEDVCGVKTVLAPGALKRGPMKYCCGTPESRLADFHALLNDPRVDLILCTRGGFGSAHILPKLDFGLLRERNLPVYGYSDISALHLAMLAEHAGIPVCAPMADGLPDAMKRPAAKETFRAVLRKRTAPRKLRLVPVEGSIIDTSLTGPLVLSNLTVMTTLCGTPWMPPLDGCILALEDVHEEARVLDRHLTHLIQAGIIEQARAVVFGYFTKCGPKPQIRRLLRDFAAQTGKPVFQGLAFGHEHPKCSYRCGETAEIIPVKQAKA
ncbi:MAG: LD-carboxypeptidase [Lentisphaeria bacterium]|nr:LD-carboxypeptidase [Lentisphaeria bacterium]